MPIELRTIMLSAEEVSQAIDSYARMAAHFLPRGHVLGFRLEPSEDGLEVGLMVSVEAMYGSTRTVIEVRTEQEDAVKLLIRCCLENNIPIPRRGIKTAAVVEGLLALVIRHEGGPVPGA